MLSQRVIAIEVMLRVLMLSFLAQFGAEPSLPPEELSRFHSLVREFAGIFSKSDDDIGRTDLAKHHIKLHDSAVPIRQNYHRVPFHQRSTMEELTNKMLASNIIEPASGPWSSPVVLVVKKKDGSSRFCVDFRKLNAATLKDAQPLPRIDETLEHLSGSCYFLST